MILRNVNVFSNGMILENRNIVTENGVVTDIAKGSGNPSFDKSHLVTAGYIDIHTHGAMGYDFSLIDNNEMSEIDDYFNKVGTMFYCPTLVTNSLENTKKSIHGVSVFRQNHRNCGMLGAHLEGPFLSSEMAGAQRSEFMLGYDEGFLKMISDNLQNIDRITISPSVINAEKLADALLGMGLQLSLGHTNALEDEILPLMKLGANSVTHLYNCTSIARRKGLRKLLGLTEIALLIDDFYAELIADGIHTASGQIALLLKNKTPQRICLVSDSISMTGTVDKVCYLGEEGSGYPLEVRDGVAVIQGTSTLAGSVTPISEMVKNLIKWGYGVEKTLLMATVTPASLLRKKDIGDIGCGKRAAFNVIDLFGNIVKTIRE